MAADGRNLDREKIVEEIISDYKKTEMKEQDEMVESVRKAERRRKLRAFFNLAGACIIVLLLIRWGAVYYQLEIANKPKFWAIGKGFIPDRETEECIGRIWQIRKAVDLYYAAHRKFPAGMSDLYEGGFLTEKLVCLASGREYVFKEVEGKKIFCCPAPEYHGVSDIWCEVRSGPPVVDR